MRATERYEWAWNAFQIHLNHNPKASLIPFLKERHVSHRSMHTVCPENYLFGITLTFPNGTIVTIKKGSAKSVMHLMKLYEKEDMLCLD